MVVPDPDIKPLFCDLPPEGGMFLAAKRTKHQYTLALENSPQANLTSRRFWRSHSFGAQIKSRQEGTAGGAGETKLRQVTPFDKSKVKT